VGTVAEAAYGYMGCGAMDILGTNFLVAYATSKQTPPFLALNTGTGFFAFESMIISL
jgi:hypothetical protein